MRPRNSAAFLRDARRLWFRMNEPKVTLALHPGLKNGVAVKPRADGQTCCTARFSRSFLTECVNRGFLKASASGTLYRLTLTPNGHAALKRLAQSKPPEPFAVTRRPSALVHPPKAASNHV